MTIVRPVERGEAPDWERMREALWPSPAGEHAGEIERYFSGDRRIAAEVLLAIGPDGRAIGFAELSIRPYAEGCAEFASDADPGNAASLAAHLALGFEEAGRVVSFRKGLR